MGEYAHTSRKLWGEVPDDHGLCAQDRFKQVQIILYKEEEKRWLKIL
jgi:hypothetical protein